MRGDAGRSGETRSMTVAALLFAMAVLLWSSGCSGDLCTRHSDCGGGLVCGAAGTCVTPPDAGVDAGPAPDGASIDASAPADAGLTADGGEAPDAGIDASPSDAGESEPDAGESEPDAGNEPDAA